MADSAAYAPRAAASCSQIAAAAQESRHAVKIERALGRAIGRRFGIGAEQAADSSRQHGQGAQIHFVVAKNVRQRSRARAAQMIEVKLRNQRGIEIAAARPRERSRFGQNMALKIGEAHRGQSQPPQLPRGMQQIEMRRERGRADCARHAIARFKQRPIETFAVECDKHGPLGEARGQLQKYRMFFSVIAHEKLLDLEASGVPPSDADQECIRAGAAGQAGGFGVEKKPLIGIFGAERGAVIRVARRGQQE